jgi:hypothetical protein
MASTKKKPASPDGLAWTKAQRAALHGARRAHPLDPPAVPVTRDEGWRDFLQEAAAQLATVRVDGGADLFAPLQRSVETGVAPTTFDTVTESLRASLALDEAYDDRPTAGLQGLVAFWVETAGAAWLWELARAPHRYGLGSWMSGAGRGRLFDGVDRAASSPNRGLGVFEHPKLRTALRRYFFALPADRFAAQAGAFKRACAETHARVAEPWRAPNVEATFVAFVLGRDGAHARELVERDDAGRIQYISNAGLLLGSVTDLALAAELVRWLGTVMVFEGADCALDFVETFGADAAPLLEAILATTVGRKPKLKPYYRGRFEAAIKLARSGPAA